jgi:hypothetical protein
MLRSQRAARCFETNVSSFMTFSLMRNGPPDAERPILLRPARSTWIVVDD